MATQQITGRQIADGAITNAKIVGGAGIDSSKLATWGEDRNAGSNKLTNLANGVNATDAVNKSQLDAAVAAASAGLSVKEPVRAASTANIAGTYAATGGASGRGSFSGMPNTVDGVALAVGNRVLLKQQTVPAQNGIWKIVTLGTGSNGTWERADDFDSDAEVRDGTFVFVQEGGQNTTQWVLTTDGNITVGGSSGSPLTWTQFGAATVYTADETTVTLTGNQFGVKSLGIGTGQLAAGAVTTAKLATGAVTANELAANAVTTAKISDGNVTNAKLAANAVNTTQIVNGAVTDAKLASGAVTTAKLATGAVDTAALAGGAVTAAKLATDSVTADAIAANAVGSVEISSGAVTTAKLATGAVTANELAANAVTTVKVANGAITGTKIAFLDQAVTGTVNGSNANFTMSSTPTAASLIVWINGIRQRPTTDFTFSGTTLTFTTAPSSGDSIAVFGIQA